MLTGKQKVLHLGYPLVAMNSPEVGCGAKAGFRNCGMRTSGINSQQNDVAAGETAITNEEK